MTAKKDPEVLTIPKWFVTSIHVIVLSSLSWVHNISSKIDVMSVKLERSLEVEGKLNSHAKIHVTKIEIAGLLHRIKVLEAK